MNLVEAGSSHTDWSMIAEAAQEEDTQAAATAMERLVRRYWPAVYAYIRGRGHDVHTASDLTQGFVCDVLISRRLCGGADPTRGRFRGLLLSAVKTYLRQRHRHEKRKRRSDPSAMRITITGVRREIADCGPRRTPEAAFCHQFSATLIQRVLANVRAGCLQDGLDGHWSVFEHRVARPMLLGDPPIGYTHLVRRLGLKDAAQAANMMVTIKRRFANALCVEVSQTVSDPGDTREEIRQLLRDLEGSS